MAERAPSKRRLRRLAKREARAAEAAAVAPALDGGEVAARSLSPSRWVQFMTRLGVEVRQVLTSPGLIVLALLRVASPARISGLANRPTARRIIPPVIATIGTVRGGFTIFLLIIAVFYGGELVWRERDRKLNEILDSTAGTGWVMTVPKIIAIFASC